MKSKYVYWIVFIALLPICWLRDFTPSNELRYLSIADEALRNGSIFTFSNHGIAYADKPPLYLWLIMICRSLFGAHCMGILSLFSLIPTFVIARTMQRWTATELTSRYQNTALWMLLSCGLFLGMAFFLRMDMLMTMFVVLALRSFYRMECEGDFRLKYRILFPIYLFLALLTKGPMGLLIPLAGTLVYLLGCRRHKNILKYWGCLTWGILLTLCAGWFTATYAEGGADYLNNLLFHQTVDRAVNSFHHERPVYYYLISILYGPLPWSLLSLYLIVRAVAKRQFTNQKRRFFLTIITTTFVLLSMISSKIDVYMLPLYPFFIYEAVLLLQEQRWHGLMATMLTVPMAALVCALPAVVYMMLQPDFIYLNHFLILSAVAILSVLSGYGIYALWHRHDFTLAIRSQALGLLAALFVGGLSLPHTNRWLGYGELCRTALQKADETGSQDLAVYGMHRPENMDVYLGDTVQILTAETLNTECLKDKVIMLPRKKMNEVIKVAPEMDFTAVGPYVIATMHTSPIYIFERQRMPL